jgi:hypothetical protein
MPSRPHGQNLVQAAQTSSDFQEHVVGAKTWMLVFSDGDPSVRLKTKPTLDREASLRLAASLFPKEALEEIGTGDLSCTCPPDEEIYIGCFPGLAIVAAKEFGIDYPSRLTQHFLAAGPFGEAWLHAMHSAVDWFAYAHWSNGRLVRSLSLSSDMGLLEDKGGHMTFEEPYWAGRYPVADPVDDPEPYPLPFHPLDLGEAALRALFGYQLEGYFDAALIEPEDVPLLKLKRAPHAPWWKFWR